MNNTTVDEETRAAQLVGMVTTKVDLNSNNFDTFVEVLEKDDATYGDIVIEMKKLDGMCRCPNSPCSWIAKLI